MDEVVLSGFLAATIRVSTPLLLAALGETLAERGGVINIGIEGAMLAGALGGAVGAAHGGLAFGLFVALAMGMAVAALFAAVSLGAGADQIITGTAVSLAAVGLTGVLNRRIFGPGGTGLSLPTFPDVPIPGLSSLPVVGHGLFTQPLVTYVAWLLVPATWWFLFRTRAGLVLRATGESDTAARAAGVPVLRVQTLAVLAGGALAGRWRRIAGAGAGGNLRGGDDRGTGLHRDRDRRPGPLAPALGLRRGPALRRGDGASVRLPGDGAFHPVSTVPNAAVRAGPGGAHRRTWQGKGTGRAWENSNLKIADCRLPISKGRAFRLRFRLPVSPPLFNRQSAIGNFQIAVSRRAGLPGTAPKQQTH